MMKSIAYKWMKRNEMAVDTMLINFIVVRKLSNE